MSNFSGEQLLYLLTIIGCFLVTVSSVNPEPKLSLKKFTTTEQRIRYHGYPATSHFVETNDGYVLNLFRLPYSHKLQNENSYRPAILLQHGLLSNSDGYLTNGPDYSLPYLLADAGYDVWFGNARGNIYSRQNTKISLKHPDFWRFDWHEIGTIDIAAMIDYITEQTNQSAIHYVGHSQGTTVYLVLMSERPEYNAKIKSAHLLAPCAFMSAGTSFIFKLFEPLIGKPGGIWNALLENIELFPENRGMNRVMDTACSSLPQNCNNTFLWIFGDGYKNTNMSALPIMLETHPGGSSSNQGIHYVQLYVSDEFRQFDYGIKGNRKTYKQDDPPNYDLSQITAATYLYSSANDALCDQAGVDKLVAQMPHLTEDYRIPDESWNHMDFVAANQVKEVINDRVIANCAKHE